MQSSKNVNFRWWTKPENSGKLFDELYNYILLNWKNEKFRDLDKLPYIINNKIKTITQSGAISRRNFESLRDLGLNVNDLLHKINPSTNKPWTADDVRQVIATNSDHQARYDVFTKQPELIPQQPQKSGVVKMPRNTPNQNVG